MSRQIVSYNYTMKVLLIGATVLAIVPIGLSLLVSDLYLGDGQNAVEHEDLGGRPLGEKEKVKDVEA